MRLIITSIALLVGMFFIDFSLKAQHDSGTTFCSECAAFDQLWNAEVISASRKVQKKNEAAGSVVVITAEMIQKRGYLTLEEVLEDVPGIDISIRQPAGEYSAHFICRGISDVGQTNMLLIVDGVIRNDVSNGWMRNIGYDFSLTDIERIEIIYGPGSSLYGANAYAGIIYIVTKNADILRRKNQVEAKINYSSWNTFSPEIYYAAKFKNNLKLQVTGNWFYSEGDKGLKSPDPGNYFHNNYEPDSVITTEYGKIPNDTDMYGKTKKIADGYDNSINDIYFKFLANHGNFTLGASFSSRDEGLSSEVVGYEYFANTPGIDYRAHHTGKILFTKYEMDINRHLHSLSLLSYRNTRILPSTGFVYTYQYQSIDNVYFTLPDKYKRYTSDGSAIRFEQQFNLNIREVNELIFGFHAESQTRQYTGIWLGEVPDFNSTIVGSTYPNEKQSVVPVYYSANLSFFVQDEMRLKDFLTLTGGLRYDYDADFGGVFIPRIAIVSQPWHNISIKLLNGKAFKSPTIFQLYDEWRGNPLLKPQYINTSELEIAIKTNKRLNLRANVYYSAIKDLIEVAPNPDTLTVPIGPNGEKETYYQNSGNTNISGLSFFADFQITRPMIFSLNYSFTFRDYFVWIDNTAMHKLNASINYNLHDQFNFNLRANYTGRVKAPSTNLYFYPKTPERLAMAGYDYVTEDDPDGYLDGRLLLNFTFTVKNVFWNGIKFDPQIIIKNLLNTQYVTMGRQSGSGVRPISDLQPFIQNPYGYIPPYHPQTGITFLLRLVMTF
ncbi:MAG: TonB-dependent receptor [Sphingobacteriales bacterium]|nr:TonB-dependent receptor [Sphingobacteriales bacterium]